MKRKILILSIVATTITLFLTLNYFSRKNTAKKFNAEESTSKLEFLLDNDYKKTFKDYHGIYTYRSFEPKFIEEYYQKNPHFRKVYQFYSGHNLSGHFEVNYHYRKIEGGYPKAIVYNEAGDKIILQQYFTEPIKDEKEDFTYFIDNVTDEMAEKKAPQKYTSYTVFLQDSEGRTIAEDSIQGKIKRERMKTS